MNQQVTSRRSYSRQTDFFRLDRMDDELSAMISDLHSYKCEPCTPDMHEQFLELKSNAHQLKKLLYQSANLLQNPSTSLGEERNEMIDVRNKFKDFQQDLSSYKTEAVVHH